MPDNLEEIMLLEKLWLSWVKRHKRANIEEFLDAVRGGIDGWMNNDSHNASKILDELTNAGKNIKNKR